MYLYNNYYFCMFLTPKLKTESGFGSISGLSTATESSRGFRSSLASVSTEASFDSPTANSPSVPWWRRNVARGKGFKPHHASLPSVLDSGNEVWQVRNFMAPNT